MNQQIQFCKSFDGTRIAYAVTGEGPPLVKAPHWLTHLEYEFRSPLWTPWINALSQGYSLLRTDERACGLSDWEVADISFEAWVRDLEAVVDAAGLERFALFGHSQGAAIAIEYAERHPERVSHLVILGGYARGWMKRGLPPERMAELEAQLKLVETGWGREDPAYRQMFALQFAPGATMEQINSLSELQRMSASAQNAVRIIRAFFMIDVRESAPRVTCPTLVLHGRGDRRAPFDEGLLLAGLIPNTRLVPLETENHILLEHEAAFGRFFEELRAFVPHADLPEPIPSTANSDRILATVLFVDIVGSTERAAAAGDARWRELLETFHAEVSAEVARFRGKVVDTAGDGVLAMFDGPARAVRCACAVRDGSARRGLEVRAGAHTGECELAGDKVMGVSVHIAARVAAMAGSGEVLVSSTVKDLVGGSGLQFADRGSHVLKGVPGKWRLFTASA